ncbi:MAG: hypothetical protein ACXWRE_12010 [Pseudobdellovibrionaceae bacterium]
MKPYLLPALSIFFVLVNYIEVALAAPSASMHKVEHFVLPSDNEFSSVPMSSDGLSAYNKFENLWLQETNPMDSANHGKSLRALLSKDTSNGEVISLMTVNIDGKVKIQNLALPPSDTKGESQLIVNVNKSPGTDEITVGRQKKDQANQALFYKDLYSVNKPSESSQEYSVQQVFEIKREEAEEPEILIKNLDPYSTGRNRLYVFLGPTKSSAILPFSSKGFISAFSAKKVSDSTNEWDISITIIDDSKVTSSATEYLYRISPHPQSSKDLYGYLINGPTIPPQKSINGYLASTESHDGIHLSSTDKFNPKPRKKGIPIIKCDNIF